MPSLVLHPSRRECVLFPGQLSAVEAGANDVQGRVSHCQGTSPLWLRGVCGSWVQGALNRLCEGVLPDKANVGFPSRHVNLGVCEAGLMSLIVIPGTLTGGRASCESHSPREGIRDCRCPFPVGITTAQGGKWALPPDWGGR